jgi:hypothetical protein
MAEDQITGFYVVAGAGIQPGIPPMIAIKVTVLDRNNSSIARDAVAVIDTGADHNVIDDDFAKANLDFVREQRVLAGGTPRMTSVYNCSVLMEEFNQRIDGECFTGPFKQTQRNYLLILGRGFLRHFDLIVRANEKEVLLRRPAQ